eukprot:2887351-Prymnesium_polylepis.1
MEELFHTPVLLSMLILCLAHRQEGSSLPVTRMELYSTAMSSALRAAAGETDAGATTAALEVLQRVAAANMQTAKGVQCEFTSDDVAAFLAGEAMA